MGDTLYYIRIIPLVCRVRMKTKLQGSVYLVIATVLYSIMPVLIRALGKGNIPPITQVFFRYIIACIASIIFFRLSKSTFLVRKKDRFLLFIVALFGYALVNVFYTFANLNTQIGTVLFIFNCSTVLGPVLGYIFLKEKLSQSMIIATMVGLISLFFLFTPGPMITWRIGAIFALISAFGSSLYVIGRKKLGQYDSSLILVANTSVGVLTVGILSFILEHSFYVTGGLGAITMTTWFLTILFGLDNFAAYYCMTKGFHLLSAGEGSMIMLTENIIGILFAFLFFGEIPTLQASIGGILILFASLLVIRSQFSKKS